MITTMGNIDRRKRRHRGIRKKIFGTDERPRLNIYRSNTNFYAQCIDDISGRVILGLSTLSPEFKKRYKYGGNKEAAKILGKMFAEKAIKEKDIKECVFDRSGYLYHGRVKNFVEGLREGGLKV